MARTAALALLAAIAAAATGCGEEEPDPGAEAAAGVDAVLTERLGPDVGDIVVACPEGLPIEAVSEFTCTVVVGGTEPVAVDLAVDADGSVRLLRAIVPTAAAEAYLAGELAGPAEGPVTADCGAAPLLVANVGDTLRCQVVRTADGSTHGVVVTVLALDGTVRYDVEPAPPVPGSVTDTTTVPPPP